MDPRRIKSRASLQAALKDLLRDHPIDQIRVEELCRAANVTRPTFYANFGSVQGLLDDYLNDVLGELHRKIRAIAPDAGPAVPPDEMFRRSVAVMTWFFETIGTEDARMGRLLSEGQAGRVEDPFAAIFHDILDQRRSEDPDQPWQPPEIRDAAIRFYTGGIVALLRLRTTRPETMSSAALATLAAKLMTFGRAGQPNNQNGDA